MGVVVSFDYAAWVAQYGEFAAVPQPLVEANFVIATTMQRNDGGGPVNNATVQAVALNLLTAHITALYSQSQNDPTPGAPKDASGMVGRISNASQGSVSAQADYGTTTSEQMAWAVQTKYGAQWWAMLAPYRRMHYLPGPGCNGGRFPTWPR